MLVLTDLIVSGYLLASVQIPEPVPDFALQAAAIYRLEVGGASFVVLYLAAMAFVLALDGRGFAELGTKGLRPTEVVQAANEQEVTLAEHLNLIRDMEENLENVEAAQQVSVDRLNVQEQRLRRLKEERRG